MTGADPLRWREGAGRSRLALSTTGATLAGHTGADPGEVARARAAVAVGCGVGPERLLVAAQVHGAGAMLVREPWSGPAPQADALVTDVPDLVLAVLVADCVPVLLADEEAGVVAVAHAGRRGMDLGVVGAALGAMAGLGARSPRAVLGPSVCAGCYEVPDDLREDVASRHPAARATTRWGTPSLDVAAGVRAQLADAGVPVTQLPGCTVEDAALGSVRRDGPTAPRWAGLAWLAA